MTEYLKKLFSVKEESLKKLYELKIDHPSSDGRFREELIKTLLEIIPQKYKVGNGFIIDSESNISKEMDLIIFDDHYVPRFFMETYSIIPIESVVGVIQVKTILNSTKLNEAINNLKSIDNLVAKKGGSVFSATAKSIIENRTICPIKIIVAGSTKTSLSDVKCKDVDIIYTLAQEVHDRLKIKKIDPVCLVDTNLDINTMISMRMQAPFENYKTSKLTRFYFAILKNLMYINNALIINYDEYLKGGLKDEQN